MVLVCDEGWVLSGEWEGIGFCREVIEVGGG